MITRCDHCGSKFEVSDELVYSADPEVRCGECMSLFDARANLFNETEHRRASATLKPVQKRVRSEKDVDQDYLETADTVAVEHVYTSAGAKLQTSPQRRSVDGIDNVNESARALGQSGRQRPAYEPEYRADYQSGYRPGYRPEPRLGDSYAADIEFERTLATETSLSGGANIKDSTNRDDAGLAPSVSSNGSADPALDDQRTADIKRKEMRERELRALQIEPERDFEALHRDDIEPDRNLSGRSRDGLAQRYDNRRSEFRDHDIALDADTVNRRDSHFIPDDVLKRSDVLRDNGRRNEDATRFKSDTPRFERSLQREQHSTASASARIATDRSDQLHEDVNSKLSQDRGSQSDYVSGADPKRKDRRSTDQQTADGIRNERQIEAETSAQEMRRFQRNRPSLQTTVIEDDLAAERVSQTTAEPRSKAGAVFWMAGLLIAMGLLLFAARGVIANMNLPEPVIAAFCQVTGCVPEQAKKDVSQLQIMRDRLYPHPEIEDALVISVDVVNQSIYKQPMPTLAVSLFNAENVTVAERDFIRGDYAVIDGSDPSFLMPGEPTRILIEIIDSGLAATNADITFE